MKDSKSVLIIIGFVLFWGFIPSANAGFDCAILLDPQTTEHRALQDAVKSEADAQFLEMYAKVLIQNPEVVNLIPTENLIYLIDQYRSGQISRLTKLLFEASESVRTHLEERGLRRKTFIGAMLEIDPAETTTALNLQLEVGRLKTQHKVARAISDSAHGNQEYGKDVPYGYHLEQVRRVLKYFGYGPKNSLLGLLLGTAARLHDILEDTNVSPAVLRQLFGNDIVSIVERVTNETRGLGVTKETENLAEREARKWRTYQRISEDPRAVILKLADRIANTIESKHAFYKHPEAKSAWPKYKKEWEGGLRAALGVPVGTERMWAYLERLMTDESFIPDPSDFDAE